MKIIRADQCLPEKKQLVLVLDLDHTLIHSKSIANLSPGETYLLNDPPNSLHRWEDTLIKMRPFARSFIKQASILFDLYIYTMASREYALNVVKFLDPHGSYFDPSKVIARSLSSSRSKKSLDQLSCQKKNVVIVDDTEEVWVHQRDHLIHIQQYHYFASSSYNPTVQSFSESKLDEDENGGALASVLDVLLCAHRMFFNNQDLERRDVTLILREIRQKILDGCCIVFSETVKSVWIMAQEMGATCCKLSERASATHVVLSNNRTKPVWLREMKDKFVVSSEWVVASYYSWRCQDEDKFQFDV